MVETATGYSALAGGIIFNHCRYISHSFYFFTSKRVDCVGLHIEYSIMTNHGNILPIETKMDSTHLFNNSDCQH